MKNELFVRVSLIILLALVFSNVTYAQTGASLYEQKCGRCHTAFEPTDYPAEDWSGIVRSMKAQSALSAQEMTDIIEYLEDAASEGGSKSSSEGPSWGGYLYTEYFQTQEKKKNFDIHYLAFYVSGWVNDKINYLGEFELEHGGTGGNNTFVEQAYIDYWVYPNIALKIGAILTPFNRFDEFHDPLTNLIITRPQLSRESGVITE